MKKYFITTSLALALCVPLFVSADTGTSTDGDIATSTSSEEVSSSTQAFITCSQGAIETRDVSLANAKITYNYTMDKALLARKEAEKKIVAITNTGTKKTATKNAVEDYKNTALKAQKTLKDARQVAWILFEDNSNTCQDLLNAELKKEQDAKDLEILKTLEQ